MSDRLPNIKIDLDAPGTFSLLLKIEQAKTLSDQAEVVKEILRLFSDADDVEGVIKRMSLKDIQRVFESLTRAVEELRQNPL